MIHPCDKLCGNKTASGYCATTVCINPQYSNIGTAQYVQGVQKRTVTNYDRLVSKTPEEMAPWFNSYFTCPPKTTCPKDEASCEKCWLDWLKEEAEE